MKQFNLDEYLKNPNRKVVTRAGKDVRIVCIDRNLDDRPIVALLQGPVCENTCFYRRNGLWLDDIETPMDLFFAREKKEGWVNIYLDAENSSYVGTCIYTSKEEAEESGKKWSCYISTVKIEWEE